MDKRGTLALSQIFILIIGIIAISYAIGSWSCGCRNKLRINKKEFL